MKHFLISVVAGLILAGCGSNSDDNQAPLIRDLFPAGGHAVQTHTTTVRGTVSDNGSVASVVIRSANDEITADLNDSGAFSARLTLAPGTNNYTVVATDASGNQTEVSTTAYFGKRVTGGNSHSAVIADSQLYTWGRNNFGQTGLGFTSTPTDANHPLAPKVLSQNPGFISVTYDQNTSVAMTAGGEVYTWGYNKYGQLGLGNAGSDVLNEEHQYNPAQVAGITDAIAVTRGYDQTLILHADGTVSAFGRNQYGQLGDGTTIDRDVPTKVSGLANIIQIDAGGSFAIAVDADGRLWSWGQNSDGQLGLGTLDNDPHSTPTQVPLDDPIEAVSLGKAHALALSRSGEVYGWGLNFSSQVGLYDRDNEDPEWPADIVSPKKLPWFNDAVAVWANGNQSFVERRDGKIYPWGQNMLGTLGLSVDDDVKQPESAVFGLANITDLGNGALHTIALRQDNQVFSWGWSFHGSLGGGNSTIERWSYRVPVMLNLPEPQAE